MPRKLVFDNKHQKTKRRKWRVTTCRKSYFWLNCLKAKKTFLLLKIICRIRLLTACVYYDTFMHKSKWRKLLFVPVLKRIDLWEWWCSKLLVFSVFQYEEMQICYNLNWNQIGWILFHFVSSKYEATSQTIGHENTLLNCFWRPTELWKLE